jgi:hypothetical protein
MISSAISFLIFARQLPNHVHLFELASLSIDRLRIFLRGRGAAGSERQRVGSDKIGRD